MKYTSKSPDETEALGRKYSENLSLGDIVALEGDLGAGKTAFARGIIQALGYNGRITSPTFAIVNEYDTEKAFVCHFDMYRILNEESLFDIGWDDYLDGNKILLIEWSENIKSALPEHYKKVIISYGDNQNTRNITFEEV